MPGWHIRVVEDTVTPVLAKLPQMIRSEADAAFQSTGQKMVQEARIWCPVLTGYLQSTIFFEMIDVFDYEFGAYADYARYVEQGTWKMPARPFLRSAFEANIMALNEAMVAAMMAALEKSR